MNVRDRHAHLTVIELDGYRVRARCDCGKRVTFNRDVWGERVSCGCELRRKDFTGRAHERLTVVGDGRGNPVTARCDCGEKVKIARRHWGHTRSCGCLRRETCAETGRQNAK